MVVAGTDAAATVLPHLASQPIAPHAQRTDVATQAGDPGGWPTLMCQVLTTRARYRGPDHRRPCWPRPRTRTSRHRNPAGLPRRPGTSNQEIGPPSGARRVSHTGNKRLKRAMSPSTFASQRTGPASQTYYQRKRQQEKRHNQAVLALTHHRIPTPHTMIHNNTLYNPQPATKLPTTT